VRGTEVDAVGTLAGQALGGAAVGVQEVHEGIAERVFESIGAAGLPVRAVHDRIARQVYRTVRAGLAVGARAGVYAVAASRGVDRTTIEDTVAGRVAVGALNGAFGDRLVEEGNPLALPMTVRYRGRHVEITREGLAESFPHATPRVAVFLHGLCETDDAWNLHAAQHAPYGARLERELGYTPLDIRYNSGRHISDNGRELARLLDEVTAAWLVEVDQIALIGHSVGGLVGRAACHYAGSSRWARKVRHVFMLGSPHRGAPLEQVTNAATHAFALLPETRVLATALNLRSAGVKDLRYGYLCEEDWFGHDPDEFLHNTAQEIPFLKSANHYFVCATLTQRADALSARLVGDLLVLRASAWAHPGRGERMRFPVDNYRHVGGASHFDLLNHPAIYEQIRRWLSGPKALPAGECGR
jgi:pimeloyl-ACP methyl ester carboxylesterase